MRTVLLSVAGAISLGFAGSVALADDPFPPIWRGQPGTTYQNWTFATSANPATPASFSNPAGTPGAVINFNPPFGTGWYDTLPAVYGSAQGFWDIASGSITLAVPTPSAPTEYQELQVTVTYWLDVSRAATISLSPTATLLSSRTTLALDPPGTGAWYTDTTLWRITPNPAMDTITILGNPGFGSVIDQVIVDTLAVPEPSAPVLAALALGGALLWCFRRRNH